MTHADPLTIHYVVGNTYCKLKSLSGGERKRKSINSFEHEWTIFVDIMEGSPDLLHSVSFVLNESFQDRIIVCKSPSRVQLSSGRTVWRFSTEKEQSTSDFRASIKLTGRGGTVRTTTHDLVLKEGGKRNDLYESFCEVRKLQDRKWAKMPNIDFGIELELSCKNGESKHGISRELLKHAGVPVTYIKEYSSAKKKIEGWKLVHDGSIECSRHYPDCSKFELVSPVLRGGEGLNECNNIVRALNAYTVVSVNKSMGFHVHISVKGLSVQELSKVCQNFVKFEDAIDSFLPPSRRSELSKNKFCKSNRLAIPGGTNGKRHQAIGSCKTVASLCDVMNPNDDRYYKLNLMNLKTGRQPTIEFRQHSATCNFDKVTAWVRFCMALVYNSAKQPRPPAFKTHMSVSDQFAQLFEQIIQDRRCRDYFIRRRTEVNREVARGPCCASCGHDGSCN